MDRFWRLAWCGAIGGLVAADQTHPVLPIFLPVLLVGALAACAEPG